MKHLCLSIVLCSLYAGSRADAEPPFRDIPMEEVQSAFDQPVPPHPRLFVPDREIAQIQECSVGTVKASLFQAVRRLREELVKVREAQGG